MKWLNRLLGWNWSDLGLPGHTTYPLDQEPSDTGEPPPIATSFRQTGKLPHSSCVRSVVCRFHSRRWLYTGDQFFRNFEDSPRKWSASERYAAKDVNTGHFFGCTVAGSESEAAAYKMDRTAHSLLEVDLALDSVLDLTYEENIEWILGQVFSNPEKLGRSYFTKLIELIHHQKGGDQVNEFIGLVAVREGYEGILFYGARALRKYSTSWTTNPEDPLIHMIEQLTFPQMREDRNLQNLVVFSGSMVARRTQRYRIDNGPWQSNPFYGLSQEELDRFLEYPSSSQPDPDWILTRKIELVPADASHREFVVFNNEN